MKSQHYILFILSFLLTQQSYAQRADIFGGINSSSFSQKIAGASQDASGNFGYHFGISAFVPFKAKTSTEGGYGVYPALLFVKKGTSNATILGPSKADVKMNYLQLNVPISYTAGSAGVGIGPYGSLATSGTKKYRVGTGAKEKIDFGNELKSLDYGLHVELALSAFKIQYDRGFANLATGTNGTVKTRTLSLSIVIPIVEK